jgi:L-ribulose-5-phosphate 3-epimerase
MGPIDRRTFLKGTTAALAVGSIPAAADEPAQRPNWRKAFMLGQTSGPIKPTFELLREAGFEGVELLSPNQLDRDEVLKARDATGLVIHGVSGSHHWGEPLSDPDPAVVERGLAAIRREFEDVKAYGGTTVLLVPAVVKPGISYRDAYTRSQANIKKLLPDAEQAGVKIAIEEVWNKFLLSSVEFARYIDEFQSDAIGAYFDVGNVVEYGYPQEWIRELGKRILKVHIKEYAKPNRFNYLLGEGKEIEWPAVRQAFLDIGYQGWFSAEVSMKDPDGKLSDLDYLKDVVQRMNRVLGLS